MVARLVSYAAAEQGDARPVDVSGLLRNLIEFREGDWKASGIRVRDLTSRESLYVLGSQGQLEQVFLNLLVHAEQSLAEAEQKSITIRTSLLAKRLLVEISFTRPSEIAQAGGDGGRAGSDAQRDRGSWRRGPADRKEQRRSALRSGTAGVRARTRRASAVWPAPAGPRQLPAHDGAGDRTRRSARSGRCWRCSPRAASAWCR